MPRVDPSCGTEALDGSGAFGEPAVRLAEFINAFPNSSVASICSTTYAVALTALCTQLGGLRLPLCLPANAQTRTDTQGHSYPDCVVSEHLTTADGAQDLVIPNCASVPSGMACWSSADHPLACPAGGQAMTIAHQPTGSDPARYTVELTFSCQVSSSVDGKVCSS